MAVAAMNHQFQEDPENTPKVRRLYMDDPLLERVQEITELISQRAFELFEAKGRLHGSNREHWLQAESEILRPMPTELSDSETELTIYAEVPGFGPAHLEVAVASRHLYVLGDRREAAPRSHRGNLLMATIELPVKIDADRIKATVKDGLLEISLPKVQTAKPLLAKSASA